MVATLISSSAAVPIEETIGKRTTQEESTSQKELVNLVGGQKEKEQQQQQNVGVQPLSPVKEEQQVDGLKPSNVQVPDVNLAVPLPNEPGPNTDLDTANTFWGGYGGYGGWGGSYYRPYYGRYYGGGGGGWGGWGGRRWGGGWGGGRWGGGWGGRWGYY